MNELTVKGSDIIEFFSKFRDNPALLYDEIRGNVSQAVTGYLNKLMEVELTVQLGRKPYERKMAQNTINYRNGFYERTFSLKGIGKLSLKVPRDRLGQFKTSVLPRYKRHEEQLALEIVSLFLGGLSTRNVELLSKQLLGFKISKAYVSQCGKELIEAVESWRNRSLLDRIIQFIYVDGVNFDVRIGDSVEKIPVLVAIGVDSDGYKTVLGFQAGDKESAGCWREFFRDLKGRGLDASKVKLGIMDGLPGLEAVFADEFINADVQRCQVHVARNVIAKAPRKLKKEVGDDLRSIFYTSSKPKAMKFFEEFRTKWESILPSCVKCLSSSIDNCLTYLKFDKLYWVSLRTSNPIERLNKEFKRRTKPMEILAGEASLYNILTFVSIKMEAGWRKSPIQADGKKAQKLLGKFTQLT